MILNHIIIALGNMLHYCIVLYDITLFCVICYDKKMNWVNTILYHTITLANEIRYSNTKHS